MTSKLYDIYVGWGDPPSSYKYEGRYNVPEYSVPVRDGENRATVKIHTAAYPDPKSTYLADDEEFLERVANLEIIDTGRIVL
ncbi:MAG: hypothetical protein ACO295_00445 [Sediminibacterium sp.]